LMNLTGRSGKELSWTAGELLSRPRIEPGTTWIQVSNVSSSVDWPGAGWRLKTLRWTCCVGSISLLRSARPTASRKDKWLMKQAYRYWPGRTWPSSLVNYKQ
jgi:hypothetical protein